MSANCRLSRVSVSAKTSYWSPHLTTDAVPAFTHPHGICTVPPHALSLPSTFHRRPTRPVTRCLGSHDQKCRTDLVIIDLDVLDDDGA
jgi:hypothetical protein